MKYSLKEKIRLIDLVVQDIVAAKDLSYQAAYDMVNQSTLPIKIDSKPMEIGHCSIGQLRAIVESDMN